MGLQCHLKLVYSFIYNEPVENGLIEHELDHVFVGYSNPNPLINPDEVQDYKWMCTDEILTGLKENPFQYTVWFRKALPELLAVMNKGFL